MDVMQLVAETLQEIDKDMESALDGLTREEIDWRPSDEANSIGFNLWHNIRVEDHWISNFAMEVRETFQKKGWDRKWDMVGAGTGWGYGKEELASFTTPPVDELLEYGREVRARTLEYMAGLRTSQLSEAPQPTHPWRGEYTIGRMFGHLLCELSQHLGHIRYIRGLRRGIDK